MIRSDVAYVRLLWSADPHIKITGRAENVRRAKDMVTAVLDTKVQNKWRLGVHVECQTEVCCYRLTGWRWRWMYPTWSIHTSLVRAVPISNEVRASVFEWGECGLIDLTVFSNGGNVMPYSFPWLQQKQAVWQEQPGEWRHVKMCFGLLNVVHFLGVHSWPASRSRSSSKTN